MLIQTTFSVVEESDRWGAFCERLHPFKLTMTFGKDRQPVAHYERPFRCFVANCKCCCFQEIDVFDGISLRSLGSVRESCWICMPQFRIYDAEHKELYHITTPHCYCKKATIRSKRFLTIVLCRLRNSS